MGVSFAEFDLIMKHPTVRTWLSAQECNVDDVGEFFRFLAGDDDSITAAEMVAGVGHLKGAAKSMDMVRLLKRQDQLGKKVNDIYQNLLLGSFPMRLFPRPV